MDPFKPPKFLVIRFAPGSAGNFLTSLLQCSEGVGHWFEHLEQDKSQQDWLSYFQKVYVTDLSQWLQNDPQTCTTLGIREIFSASYDRGNDLTVEQFAQQEIQHCSAFYFDLKRQNRYIPILWHKNFFPAYFSNATFVNIMLDADSIRWFDRSYYRKHFRLEHKNQDGSFIMRYERHRPSIVPSTFTGTNDYLNYHTNFFEFARQEIFGNVWRKRYLDNDYLNNTTNGRPEFTLGLSELLSFEKLEPTYRKLCKFLTIDPMPANLLQELFLHWRQCHDY